MDNSNDIAKDLEQNPVHPAPDTDPGAEIETVIPGPEKGEASSESSNDTAKKPADPVQESADAGENEDNTDQEHEPEVSGDEGGESKTDEHGITRLT